MESQMQENLTEQCEKFWQILPHPSSDSVVRLFAKQKGRIFGDFARSSNELKRFILGCPDGNVYVAPNPTNSTTGLRHSAHDVTHWSFLFLDIDPVESSSDPNAALEEILALVGGWSGHDLLMKYRPTIIDSGRGVQAWLRLKDESLSDTNTQGLLHRNWVRRLMSYWLRHISDRVGLLHGCRLDTSVSDLPRVMRMPFTVNQKTGRETKVLHYQEHPYPWLAPFLIAGAPDSIYLEPDPLIMPEGTPWQMVFNRLSLETQKYYYHGKSEPGRHKIAWHTFKTFCELGISKEQAFIFVREANSRRGEDEELDEGALNHAYKTAYGE